MVNWDNLGIKCFVCSNSSVARKLGIPFTIPNHKEIFDDGIGNKLRIELFDCFDIQPDSIGVLDTGNVLAERGFEFNESVFD